ncbi:MAG: helix-turn-helix domain-containing protein [Deltaproteobacteria bacterium]|nr:helix-turn-helix domain-containing protein [Deltaproteobacteria bacterium]
MADTAPLLFPPRVVARDRKGDRTREQLFQAAIEEFRRVGVAEAGIGQIAARAGTSRANFYFYYRSKEAVLLDMQSRLERDIVERIAARATLREALTEVIDALIDVEARLDPELLREALSVYIRRPPGLDLNAQPFPLRSEVARRFSEDAAGGARAREARAGLDPEQATHLFLGGLFGLLVNPRGPVAARRDEALQLVGLFLESPPPAARS